MRRERPHPGAQLSFTDSDGHRFQAILTDREGEAAALERDHRARARCEDRIRCAKDTGLELLPFRAFAMNAVWLELVLIAQLLLALTDTLLLRGELAGLEPKRLRHRALHAAGRLAFHARRATLRLRASLALGRGARRCLRAAQTICRRRPAERRPRSPDLERWASRPRPARKGVQGPPARSRRLPSTPPAAHAPRPRRLFTCRRYSRALGE